MLGTLPSKYLKWVSKTLRARDYEEWAKLADEVLQDPVYKDRLEWELAEKILTGDDCNNKTSSTRNPVSDLLDFISSLWVGVMNSDRVDDEFQKIPDHLLIEIFIRVPNSNWAKISCVNKHWANIFQGETLWQAAIIKTWPRGTGSIPRGGSCRRIYTALYASKHVITKDHEIAENPEVVGNAYLLLKEQIEISTDPFPLEIIHGTIIDDFIACGKSRDKAHEMTSQIWLAVIDNMVENEHTFELLKRLVQEGDVFLPYPYSRSYKVQWRVFEKLLTDFRDCFNKVDYFEVLGRAKYKFLHRPPSWLGY
ncbi:hypothetical protein GIB67_027969 [Kingdonia uniflora]|uniref:F-box domain-containing protein n=2 Tax=Kingdonia uniflora TaxID=39325 RepID=A0A7J7LGJ4_9MAGN|nr:hypothetical protein GIB67_027969 [Kingdonia uniflora]